MLRPWLFIKCYNFQSKVTVSILVKLDILIEAIFIKHNIS